MLFTILGKIQQLWLNFFSAYTNSRILSAMLTVGVITVFVRIISVAKELFIAWHFGVSDDLDAFFIALIIPFFFVNVIAASFNTSFIPTYIEVREKHGIKASQKLFSTVMVLILLLLSLSSILIATIAPLYLPILAKGFDYKKLELTLALSRTLCPYLIFSGITIFLGAVLNASGSFALNSWTPIINPIVTIIFLFAFSSWNAYALTFAMVIASFSEMVILSIALKKQGFSLQLKWYGITPYIQKIIAQYLPMIAGASIMGSANLIDQSMASMLDSGSVASLNYGSRLISLPLGIISLAIATAVLPHFSQLVAQENYKELKLILKKYLKFIFLTTIPLTLILIIVSFPLIQVTLQRGSFTIQDTILVSQIQSCYTLQIPFYIGGILLVRLISSLRANHILMQAAFINLMVNIIFNYIFMNIWGVAGIALSTSLVYFISFIFCFDRLRSMV